MRLACAARQSTKAQSALRLVGSRLPGFGTRKRSPPTSRIKSPPPGTSQGQSSRRVWKRRWFAYARRLTVDKAMREAVHGLLAESEILAPPPPTYRCATCGVTIATGMRYHCEICRAGFELCFNCKNGKSATKHRHTLTPIPTRHERAKRAAAAEARRLEAERVLSAAAGRRKKGKGTGGGGGEGKDADERGARATDSSGTTRSSASEKDRFEGVTDNWNVDSEAEDDEEEDVWWRRDARLLLPASAATVAGIAARPNTGANAYRPYATPFSRLQYAQGFGEGKSPDNVTKNYALEHRGGDGWSPKRGGPARVRDFAYRVVH